MPSKSPNQYTGKNPSKFSQSRLRDTPPTEKPYMATPSSHIKVGEAPTGPEPIPTVQIPEPVVPTMPVVTDAEKTARTTKRKNRYNKE